MGYRAIVVTISDRASAGLRKDTSGPEIARMLTEAGYEVRQTVVVPDERVEIERALVEIADSGHAEVVITTGGTGLSPRDVTPEATRAVIDKEIPGMTQAMISRSLEITPHAMLSRGVCGIRKKTLIINLPGSPRAARENLQVVLPALPHAIDKMKGDPSECG